MKKLVLVFMVLLMAFCAIGCKGAADPGTPKPDVGGDDTTGGDTTGGDTAKLDDIVLFNGDPASYWHPEQDTACVPKVEDGVIKMSIPKSVFPKKDQPPAAFWDPKGVIVFENSVGTWDLTKYKLQYTIVKKTAEWKLPLSIVAQDSTNDFTAKGKGTYWGGGILAADHTQGTSKTYTVEGPYSTDNANVSFNASIVKRINIGITPAGYVDTANRVDPIDIEYEIKDVRLVAK